METGVSTESPYVPPDKFKELEARGDLSRVKRRAAGTRQPSKEIPTPKKIEGTDESQPAKDRKIKRASGSNSKLAEIYRHTHSKDLPGGVKALDIYDEKVKNQIHSKERGEHLQDTFELGDGTLVATEVATRVNVVGRLSKAHLDRIKHLEQRISEVSGNSQRRLKIQLELTKDSFKVLRSYASKGQHWAASGSYRALMAKVGLEEAHKKYLPVCVNLRSQGVQSEKETDLTINRSGAISDYRYGQTNLVELQALRASLLLASSVDELTEDQIAICKSYFGDTLPQDLTILKDKVERVVVEREWVLENQALQDVSQHIASLVEASTNASVELSSKKVFTFGRVSMLDGIKEPRNDEGFILNERNQMLDMQGIYEMLDGKALVFDGRGPFLDDQGKIHLPTVVHGTDGKPIEKPLQIVYFNISAQGNIKNVGAQEPINKAALERLGSLIAYKCGTLVKEKRDADALILMQRFNKLRDQLQNEVTDGFDAAEEAAMLLLDTDSFLSINCFSGKDRTGLLAALITFNRLKGLLRGSSINPKQREAILSIWGRQLMREHGIACSVVKDNTGYSALKLMPDINIKLLMRGEAADFLLGCSQRIQGIGKALGTFMVAPGEMGTARLYSE